MDTLLQPTYIYEETLSKQPLDADSFLIKQKNLTPTIDQQKGQGSYLSGKVIIDAQNFGNGSDFIDWSNAYIALPYHFKVDLTVNGNKSLGLYDPDMLVAPKNMSLVDSIRVEQAGRVVVQESSNLAHLVNFIKHTTTSPNELHRQDSVLGYYPDDSDLTNQQLGIWGTYNNSNYAFDDVSDKPPVKGPAYNEGLYRRQLMLGCGNQFTNYIDPNNGSLNEAAVYQEITSGEVAETPLTANVPKTISDQHFIAIIKLADLSDYFKKHPLSKCGYKITLTVNQASTTMISQDVEFSLVSVPGPTQKPFDSAAYYKPNTTTLYQNATVQPGMLCVGRLCYNSNVALNVSGTPSSAICTLTLTSEVDTSTKTRQQGVILYTPSYTLSESAESKLLSQPIINKQPFMFNSAVYTGLTPGNNINLQLFSAITNPRLLVVIPQYASSAQGQSSQCSAFNSCPGTTDALSLTRLQIRVNSKTILPAPTSYGYEQFIQNTSQILSVNGGLSPFASGMIDIRKFSSNYRYYAFDLSLLPADQVDIAQLITFEGMNNSLVPVDLYVYCIYESSCTFDLLKGTVDIK